MLMDEYSIVSFAELATRALPDLTDGELFEKLLGPSGRCMPTFVLCCRSIRFQLVIRIQCCRPRQAQVVINVFVKQRPRRIRFFDDAVRKRSVSVAKEKAHPNALTIMVVCVDVVGSKLLLDVD